MPTAQKHLDTSPFCKTRQLLCLLAPTTVCMRMHMCTWEHIHTQSSQHKLRLKQPVVFHADSSPKYVPTITDIIALIWIMELSLYTEIHFTYTALSSLPHPLSLLLLTQYFHHYSTCFYLHSWESIYYNVTHHKKKIRYNVEHKRFFAGCFLRECWFFQSEE